MRKKFSLGAALLMLVQTACPLVSLAQTVPVNLDLSSTEASVQSKHSANITVGGNTVQVETNDLITPAQGVAVAQIVHTGVQSIVIGSDGNAIGGSFNLSAAARNGVSSLIIPAGVTAISDAARLSNINVLGNLVNSGSIQVLSQNSQVTSAAIAALNISNLASGLITSAIPQGGIAGFNPAVNNLNLSLNAVQNLLNSGTIISSGSLTVSAGNSIINSAAPGTFVPTMEAFGTLNILSNVVQNAGIVSSLTSNINVASQLASNISINNAGTFSALNGIIQVRDELFTPKFDSSLIGGDWLSKELNVFSGDGNITVDVNLIAGQVNLVGGNCALSAIAGDLKIGALKMSGDPTVSSGGDVILQQSRFGGEWLFPGLDALIINAGGNIINEDVTQIGTARASGGTGAVIMTAKGMIDLQTAPISQITTETGNGNSGNIILTAGGPILLSGALTTKSAGGSSGDIKITSNGGAVKTSGALVLNSTSSNNGGDITISAAADISLSGGIEAKSGSGSGSGGSISFSSTSGNISLGSGSANKTVLSTAAEGMSGQIFVQADSGSIEFGDGEISLVSESDAAGMFSAFAGSGGIHFGQGKIDASGLFGGFISALTLTGKADIDMSKTDLIAKGTSSGYSGSVAINSGLNGANEVESDEISIASISLTGGDGSLSSVSLTTTVSDARIGAITGSGSNISISAGKNLQIDSIANNNSTGFGGTISLTSNTNFAFDANTSQLSVNATSGDNHVYSISNVAGTGGGLFISNIGLGGINAGALSQNAAFGDGGNISLNSDGDITLSGSSYVLDGSSGAGGQILISSGKKVIASDVSISAQGGDGFSGGSLVLSAQQAMEIGQLKVNTSGHGTGSAGSVGIGAPIIEGGSISVINNGGGATSVQVGGDVQLASLQIVADGGEDPGKNGGNIAVSLSDHIKGIVDLQANGAVQGSGGSISLSSNTNLDLQNTNASLRARGGSDIGNGGFVFVKSNGSMILDASKIDVSPQAEHGNGGHIEIETGLDPNSASGNLNGQGQLSADGKGAGNGGSVKITVLNTLSEVSNLIVGKGFSVSANSGTTSGHGGQINIASEGNLSIESNAVLARALGVNGNGGQLTLTAGGSSSENVSSSSNAKLELGSGTYFADGTGTGNGGKILLCAPTILTEAGNKTILSYPSELRRAS